MKVSVQCVQLFNFKLQRDFQVLHLQKQSFYLFTNVDKGRKLQVSTIKNKPVAEATATRAFFHSLNVACFHALEIPVQPPIHTPVGKRSVWHTP